MARYNRTIAKVEVATSADLQEWLDHNDYSNVEGAAKLGVSRVTLHNWLRKGLYPRNLAERLRAADANEKPEKSKAVPLRWIIVGDDNKSQGQKVRWTVEQCEAERQRWVANGWHRANDGYWGKLVEDEK